MPNINDLNKKSNNFVLKIVEIGKKTLKNTGFVTQTKFTSKVTETGNKIPDTKGLTWTNLNSEIAEIPNVANFANRVPNW